MSASKKSAGFTLEEKAAIKERAKELKASASRAEAAEQVLAKIAEMQKPDRIIAEKLHALIAATAPSADPKLWYGMPAWTQDGKTVCFFQDAAKFKARYATLGFNDSAQLDDGELWPTAFAVTSWTPSVEKRVRDLIKRAMG